MAVGSRCASQPEGRGAILWIIARIVNNPVDTCRRVAFAVQRTR
jgi:hypothetical protein